MIPKTRTGKPNLVLHFDVPPPEPLKLLVYCEYTAALSINEKYSIDLSYNSV